MNGNQKYLVVYYDKRLDNFNEAINTALEKHGLDAGECPVLCLPISKDTGVSEKVSFLKWQGGMALNG